MNFESLMDEEGWIKRKSKKNIYGFNYYSFNIQKLQVDLIHSSKPLVKYHPVLVFKTNNQVSKINKKQ